MPGQGRKRLSLYTALALWGLLCAIILRQPPGNVLSWDTFGYHLYLPATFIHGDPGISDPSWVVAANDTYQNTGTLYQISELPNGRWVDKYPMGLAMLWSPFFLAAHAAAGIMGYPQDGFSAPYQWGLLLAGMLFLLVGLLLSRKVLLTSFSDALTAAVLMLLVLGTNYLHQATQGTGMPHIFLFALGAAVLYLTVLWRRGNRLAHAMALGAVLGLMVAARPTEVVWVFVPLCFGVTIDSSWRAWLGSIWARRGHFGVMALTAALMGLPQLVYWKWMTGHWLYMSYNNAGEGFEFLHPYLREILLSFRKGWYVYTPVMLFATAGILFLWTRAVEWRWSVLAFFILNLYIVGSWSCWWYADSFGQRALVQSYATLIIPLAASIDWLAARRAVWRILGIAALMCCVVLNLFQTWQVNHGIMHTSRMTWPAYRAAWMSTSMPADMDRLLLFGRSYAGEDARPSPGSYERMRIAEWDLTMADAGSMTAEQSFTKAWRVRWDELTDRDHIWVEVNGRMRRAVMESPAVSLVTTMEHKGHSYGYKATDIHWTSDSSEWTGFSAWYLSPEIRRPGDELVIYGWLRDATPCQLISLDIFIHEPKP